MHEREILMEKTGSCRMRHEGLSVEDAEVSREVRAEEFKLH